MFASPHNVGNWYRFSIDSKLKIDFCSHLCECIIWTFYFIALNWGYLCAVAGVFRFMGR